MASHTSSASTSTAPNTNDQLRECIVTLIADFPTLQVLEFDENDQEWERLQLAVHNRMRIHFQVPEIQSLVKGLEEALKNNLQKWIVVENNDVEEVERRLRQTGVYPHFMTFRNNWQSRHEAELRGRTFGARGSRSLGVQRPSTSATPDENQEQEEDNKRIVLRRPRKYGRPSTSKNDAAPAEGRPKRVRFAENSRRPTPSPRPIAPPEADDVIAQVEIVQAVVPANDVIVENPNQGANDGNEGNVEEEANQEDGPGFEHYFNFYNDEIYEGLYRHLREEYKQGGNNHIDIVPVENVVAEEPNLDNIAEELVGEEEDKMMEQEDEAQMNVGGDNEEEEKVQAELVEPERKRGRPLKMKVEKEEVEESDEEDDDFVEDLPVAIVYSRNVRNRLPKIKYVNKLKFEVPASCEEARRAMDREERKVKGSLRLPRTYPGVPNRKFTEDDYDRNTTKNNRSWTIQCVMEDEEREVKDPKKRTKKNEEKKKEMHWHVFYEGWAVHYTYPQSFFEESAEVTLQVGRMRSNFLKYMRENGDDEEVRREAEILRLQGHTMDFKSMMWDFEDLSYFHSVMQLEYSLAPVLYMSLRKDRAPPNYNYTTVNVMSEKVLEHCMKQNYNKEFKKVKKTRTAKKYSFGCEKHKTCVCTQMFDKLHGITDPECFVMTTKTGLLDLTKFDASSIRLMVECSDACGCTSSCPRRNLQRGQQKPLVVFHEGSKGYGLRAGADIKGGEYIGEYTGELMIVNERADTSYQADVIVMDEELAIDSRRTGNIIRFMSHSCDPSAAFVVTHTRELESDVVLPRVAVYAIKDIKFGEEVTISYYSKETLEELSADEKPNECLCGSTKCHKRLP